MIEPLVYDNKRFCGASAAAAICNKIAPKARDGETAETFDWIRSVLDRLQKGVGISVAEIIWNRSAVSFIDYELFPFLFGLLLNALESADVPDRDLLDYVLSASTREAAWNTLTREQREATIRCLLGCQERLASSGAGCDSDLDNAITTLCRIM